MVLLFSSGAISNFFFLNLVRWNGSPSSIWYPVCRDDLLSICACLPPSPSPSPPSLSSTNGYIINIRTKQVHRVQSFCCFITFYSLVICTKKKKKPKHMQQCWSCHLNVVGWQMRNKHLNAKIFILMFLKNKKQNNNDNKRHKMHRLPCKILNIIKNVT